MPLVSEKKIYLKDIRYMLKVHEKSKMYSKSNLNIWTKRGNEAKNLGKARRSHVRYYLWYYLLWKSPTLLNIHTQQQHHRHGLNCTTLRDLIKSLTEQKKQEYWHFSCLCFSFTVYTVAWYAQLNCFDGAS